MIMYASYEGQHKPIIGQIFKYRPTLLQRIFGFKKFGRWILLEYSPIGIKKLIKVEVPDHAKREETMWGELVSECKIVDIK